VNLRTSHAILRPNRVRVNKMRMTLDRKKHVVALASLFDVRIRNSRMEAKSARSGVSDRKLSSYPMYAWANPCAYTCDQNVTGVTTLQLQATKNERYNIWSEVARIAALCSWREVITGLEVRLRSCNNGDSENRCFWRKFLR